MGSLWNRSGTVERQDDDIRASGAQAFFFNGGTTTPLTVYQDAAQSAAHPNPVLADSKGRWPDVFVPYIVAYDVEVTTSGGVQLSFTQNIPNPDPVSLSVTIPAENQVQTGMIHGEFVNATKAGYVRLNGRTLGNAVSGATERANADTSNLFVYLWNNLTDAVAPVSSGRGGSAASDFAANKTITLPDLRGASLHGLDDMGNSALGAYSAQTFSVGSAILAGSPTGGNSIALAAANMPAHTHTGSTSNDGNHQHSGTTDTEFPAHAHVATGSTDLGNATHSHGGNVDSHNHAAPNLATIGGVQSGGGLTVVTGYAAGTSAFNTSNATPGLTTDSQNAAHSHTITNLATGAETALHTHTFTSQISGIHQHTFTTSSVGSGTAFDKVASTRLVTWFIKL